MKTETKILGEQADAVGATSSPLTFLSVPLD